MTQGRNQDFRPLAIGIPAVFFLLAACSPAFYRFPDLLQYLNIVIPPEVSGLLAAIAIGFLLNCLFNEMWGSHVSSPRNREKAVQEGTEVLVYRPQKLWALDAERAFYDQRIFNWSIRIPLYTLGIVLVLASNGNDSPFSRPWRFDHVGFSEFLSLYQFPIYLLSIMGILGVMVARFHRSKQFKISLDKTDVALGKTDESLSKTDMSLRLTREKNDFDRRFKHEEKFVEYITAKGEKWNVVEGIELQILSPQAMYSDLFRENLTSVEDMFVPLKILERKLDVLKNEFCDRIEYWQDLIRRKVEWEELEGAWSADLVMIVEAIELECGLEVLVDGKPYLSEDENGASILASRSVQIVLFKRVVAFLIYASNFLSKSTPEKIKLNAETLRVFTNVMRIGPRNMKQTINALRVEQMAVK